MRKRRIIVLEVFGFLVLPLDGFLPDEPGLFKTMNMSSTQMIVINIFNCKTRMYVQRQYITRKII